MNFLEMPSYRKTDARPQMVPKKIYNKKYNSAAHALWTLTAILHSISQICRCIVAQDCAQSRACSTQYTLHPHITLLGRCDMAHCDQGDA